MNERIWRKSFTLSLAVLIMIAMSAAAAAYTIDGDLDDWGVDPSSGYWSADPPAYSVYDNWRRGPSSTGSIHNPGIEQCDVEALYVADINDSYLYFAVILSMPPDGYDYYDDDGVHHLIAGDLALNMDNNDTSGEFGYEYGIKLTNDSRTVSGTIGDVFYMPDWERLNPEVAQNCAEFSNMVNGTYTGHADVVYKLYEDWSWDNGWSNYVIEMKVPKSALGVTGNGTADIQATVSCTNDVLTIEDFEYSEIPEFHTIAIPAGMILCLFFIYRRKRQG